MFFRRASRRRVQTTGEFFNNLLERAAVIRKPKIMPSVLKITLRCAPCSIENMVKPICDIVKSSWPRIGCAEKYGTVDFGGDWLFFPANGYNPNVSGINAYEDYVEAQAGWPKWRERHNVTFESEDNRKHDAPPRMIIHSLEPKRPAWPGSS